MQKSFGAGLCALALSILAAGCAGGDNTNSGNANMSNTSNMTSEATNMSPNSTMTGGGMSSTAGDSEISMSEAGGVRTQTRTFRNNRVERVVVTTDASGKRTARVYSRGEVRELPESKIEQALSATGEAIADSAGFVADKAEDVGRPVADKAEDVGGAVVDKSKDVGRVVADKSEDVGRGVADKAEDVGRPVVKGAKKVGGKTVSGAKKVGGAIKDAVTP